MRRGTLNARDLPEALIDALASLASERSAAQVMQRIVDLARELVGARYAALGVADARGRIQEFHTSGITPQQRAAIGPPPRGHGLLGVLIREGRVLRIPDISRDPRSAGFPPHHPPMTSLLGVPIIAGDGRVLGDLYLTDKIGAPEFDEEDERIALLLARHAAVAIENARRNEMLERQLQQIQQVREFGEAIGRELDLDQALQAIAQRVRALLRAGLAGVALLSNDGSVLTFEAADGRRVKRVLGLRVPVAASIMGAVVAARKGEVVQDLAADPRTNLRVLEATGGRSGIYVPLMAAGRPIGCLAVVDAEDGRRFSETDLQLAEALAQQAAVVIENARLYQRARQEASKSRALLDVTRAMNSSMQLGEILQLITDSVAELVGTPAAAVYLLAPEHTSSVELVAARAMTPAVAVGDAGSLADTLAGQVIASGSLVVVGDTTARPDLRAPRLRDGSVPLALAAVPIKLGGAVLGVIEVASTEAHRFSEDDVDLLTIFAEQAATAIQSARLYAQSQELALVRERDRIARELHDGIIQTIYAVGLNVEYCRAVLHENPEEVEGRLAEAGAGLNQAIQDIRNYIVDLKHAPVRDVDLRTAIERLALEFSGGGVQVVTNVTDEAATAVVGARRAQVLQIVREALANATKHARASRIEVQALVEGGNLSVSVVDNGVGFDPTVAGRDGHLGLRNLTARARELDGYLDLRSQPGQGTEVLFTLPLHGTATASPGR